LERISAIVSKGRLLVYLYCVSAQICEFFCGIEVMQPWYYVNVSSVNVSKTREGIYQT
jgi:hypothetical protein